MKLGVNIDHVATLRNARWIPGRSMKSADAVYPDPVKAALIAQKSGAHSIVMHLREDRRHVRDEDLYLVKKAIRIRLNMEMSVAPDIVRIAAHLGPHQATLVPERRKERTTEGGLNLLAGTRRIEKAIRTLKSKKIEVSLFIDPDRSQLEAAQSMGADAVEFHTGDYANAVTEAERKRQWKKLYDAALFAKVLGVTSHAGHGLDYENVELMKKIPGLIELNIGYAIVTRALWVGFENAVRQMQRLVR
jgi:pyridoxine 5-phosphate synthase